MLANIPTRIVLDEYHTYIGSHMCVLVSVILLHGIGDVILFKKHTHTIKTCE